MRYAASASSPTAASSPASGSASSPTSAGPRKPLMLMLHGFPECWYSWRDQLAAFRDEYEVGAGWGARGGRGGREREREGERGAWGGPS